MENKCGKCGVYKTSDFFRKDRGHGNMCKECKSLYDKEYRSSRKQLIHERNLLWYKKNRESHLEALRKYRRNNPERVVRIANETRKRKRLWFNNLKAGLECKVCGENSIACLDFHHREKTEKLFTVGAGTNGYSKAQILEEIKKCDMLCANCHRKLHHNINVQGVTG